MQRTTTFEGGLKYRRYSDTCLIFDTQNCLLILLDVINSLIMNTGVPLDPHPLYKLMTEMVIVTVSAVESMKIIWIDWD